MVVHLHGCRWTGYLVLGTILLSIICLAALAWARLFADKQDGPVSTLEGKTGRSVQAWLEENLHLPPAYGAARTKVAEQASGPENRMFLGDVQDQRHMVAMRPLRFVANSGRRVRDFPCAAF